MEKETNLKTITWYLTNYGILVQINQFDHEERIKEVKIFYKIIVLNYSKKSSSRKIKMNIKEN